MASDLQAIDEEFSQRKMDKHLFRRLWASTAPHRGRYYGNIGLALIAKLSAFVGPKIIQVGIDRFMVNGDAHGVLIVSGIFLANLLVVWALTIAQTHSVTYFGEKVINDVRGAVFRHIQRLSMNYFDKVKAGRIIA